MNPPGIPFPELPPRIGRLSAVAANLSWSWSRDARVLFRSIDPVLWHRSRHNPIAVLQQAGPARLAECADDPEFVRLYEAVCARADRDAEARDTWYARTAPEGGGAPVAYFCAEFGLHSSVPIYAGGLGVLAGDHCKAASDLGVPLVGVGLSYTKGYFDQVVGLDGWQQDASEPFSAAITPLEWVLNADGGRRLVTIEMSGRRVHVGAWRMRVGRVPLFLLDTNIDGNEAADRELSHALYAGDRTHRLRQEWLLGVGGVRVLRALGIAPAAWHANEGHAAFMMVERVRELCARGAPWDEAVVRVRSSTVFTTHTPVPAGHDVFAHGELLACAEPMADDPGFDAARVLALGRHPDGGGDEFHMTVAAIRLARRVNGVSRVHGAVTRRMWRSLWPDRPLDRIPIGHVTNGVHLPTWIANSVIDLVDRELDRGWADGPDDPDRLERVLAMDDAALWATHHRLKVYLLEFIREEARRQWRDARPAAGHLVGAGTLLSDNALTVGFARRFATYKRASLLLRDPDRLRRLLCDPRRPVQLIFSGKAHPADVQGKLLLQEVYTATRDPRFEGRIAFLEDYELHIAHRLVQGVDLWLNLPRVPLEACGTSGMKAALNGVPQLATEDGWWAEGYTGLNGWSIPAAAPDDPDPDASDAEQLFRLLEEQVVPAFFTRDARGVPVEWVRRMKHAIRTAAGRFTAARMVAEYVRD
ncbi:MAG: alpha-glucan family phosphorylase, partial [Gemmatimonadota bacterium]|nr:alpha-glucan family phosphorylase [Gemmatimonadota bacterium]